jgi:hypothetical protein
VSLARHIEPPLDARAVYSDVVARARATWTACSLHKPNGKSWLSSDDLHVELAGDNEIEAIKDNRCECRALPPFHPSTLPPFHPFARLLTRTDARVFVFPLLRNRPSDHAKLCLNMKFSHM